MIVDDYSNEHKYDHNYCNQHATFSVVTPPSADCPLIGVPAEESELSCLGRSLLLSSLDILLIYVIKQSLLCHTKLRTEMRLLAC